MQFAMTALDRTDFAASRVILIPKGNGEFRPLQVQNSGCRLFEKALRQRLLAKRMLESSEDQYGFKAGCSTHDPFLKLQSFIKNNQNPKVAFLDLQKAYNSVPISKLIKLLEREWRGERKLFTATRELLRSQSIRIDQNYYRPGSGVPQGSALSPELFNKYFELVLEDLRRELPEMEIYAFADDVALASKTKL